MTRKLLCLLTIVTVLFALSPAQDVQRIRNRSAVAPPPAEVDFATDTFTEASDTELSLHTGELGATWTKHPAAGYSGNILTVDAATDRIWPNGTTAYYASGTPPSADYTVCADYYLHTAISQNISVAGRMDTTADTMYVLRLNDGTSWTIRRIIAGAQTTIITSTNQLPAAGTFKTACLVMVGDQISGTINGVTELAAVTDANITATGKAGVRNAGAATSSTGIHLDNFSAQ